MDLVRLNIVLLFFVTSAGCFSQKKGIPEKDQWTYTLSNSGRAAADSIQLEIISNPRADFQIQYKNGDTLLWQMISNNAGPVFLARRGVDSLILSSNYFPAIRIAFRDYPLQVLTIDYQEKSEYDKFKTLENSTLRADFLADPTGCLGLREKHVTQNSTETLFDNQSLIGLTKEELVALIGEPSEIDGMAKRMKRHKPKGRQCFSYFISICGEQQTGYSISVLIQNNQVVQTMMRMHCG